MNIIKHMEAAFLIALGVAGVASATLAGSEPAQARVPAQAVVENSIGTPGHMAVVKVSAKRLTPAQKQQLLAMEQARSRA